MITISKNPLTKLNRKLEFEFVWLQRTRQIKIRCYVSHYDENDLHILNSSTVDFTKDLIANDKTLVVIETGHTLTKEEMAAPDFDKNSPKYTSKYNYYVSYIGSKPIILSSVIEKIIETADINGEFNS